MISTFRQVTLGNSTNCNGICSTAVCWKLRLQRTAFIEVCAQLLVVTRCCSMQLSGLLFTTCLIIYVIVRISPTMFVDTAKPGAHQLWPPHFLLKTLDRLLHFPNSGPFSNTQHCPSPISKNELTLWKYWTVKKKKNWAVYPAFTMQWNLTAENPPKLWKVLFNVNETGMRTRKQGIITSGEGNN